MVAPPIEHSAPGPGEEADDEEYESDVYDVEDDEEDVDYEGEEDDDDGDEEERGVSLTALLVSDPSKVVDEDEDDEVYAPAASDEKVPAIAPIDGNIHVAAPDRIPEVQKGATSLAPPPVAATAGIKRKTSGDEQESSGEEDEESDAKKLKS